MKLYQKSQCKGIEGWIMGNELLSYEKQRAKRIEMLLSIQLRDVK